MSWHVEDDHGVITHSYSERESSRFARIVFLPAMDESWMKADPRIDVTIQNPTDELLREISDILRSHNG